MRHEIINCDLHDYLEISCIYKYHVVITLKTGEKITGQAKTTQTDRNQTEYLIFRADNKQTRLNKIPMLQIAKLGVITENAMFNEVNFITREIS